MRIILCPEGTVIDNEHTLTHQTWFLMSIDCSVIGAHLHHVDDTAIHKTASTEGNCLDTNVHAVSTGMFVTDCHISTMRTLSWDGPSACAISH